VGILLSCGCSKLCSLLMLLTVDWAARVVAAQMTMMMALG
jgi:hypothetical protein